jgi:hypothetical protein
MAPRHNLFYIGLFHSYQLQHFFNNTDLYATCDSDTFVLSALNSGRNLPRHFDVQSVYRE